MAVEPGDTKFVSKLDEASKNKAKEELHELNDADRALAVQTLRTWVLQQKDWLNTPTDFEFLLRFLRVRKFSQLGARKTLENYWTCKTKSPEWFKNIDPTDDNVKKMLKSGVCVSPKRYDQEGRRLVTVQMQAYEKMFKSGMKMDFCYSVVALFYEWLILDENVQVNGIQLFVDYKGVTMGTMLASMANDRGKRFIDFYKKALPMRLKRSHIYNEPHFMDAIIALLKPLMSQKMIDRVHFCGSNMANVYENVDMSLIASEYLPDDYENDRVQSVQQIADDMVADMMKPEFLDYIRKLNSGEYGVNLDKRMTDKDVPEGSFRKLNVD